MTDKLISIIKDKQYVVSGLLLKSYKTLNITSEELILLIYLINNNSNKFIFNPVVISEDLNIPKKEIMILISSLSSKKIISLDVEKNEFSKMEEHIKIDNILNKLIGLLIEDKKSTEDNSIFVIFEKEFGRTISPMEYEIINSWLNNNIKEELILEALKEAIYNGVTSLRYIDKILFEWKKKDIKTIEDVKINNKNFKNKNKDDSDKKDIFEYNWLDEE